MSRLARKPFTFSDGTYIPKGTLVEVAVFATHRDDTNYPEPSKFSPFRFVDKNSKENDGRKADMVSTHADFLAFGHGVHACPGRFFAADMLKLMMAHVVMNYDVKLAGGRPKPIWVFRHWIPKPSGELMFRNRKV